MVILSFATAVVHSTKYSTSKQCHASPPLAQSNSVHELAGLERQWALAEVCLSVQEDDRF